MVCAGASQYQPSYPADDGPGIDRRHDGPDKDRLNDGHSITNPPPQDVLQTNPRNLDFELCLQILNSRKKKENYRASCLVPAAGAGFPFPKLPSLNE